MKKLIMMLLASSAFIASSPIAAQTLDELARMVREAAAGDL